MASCTVLTQRTDLSGSHRPSSSLGIDCIPLRGLGRVWTGQSEIAGVSLSLCAPLHKGREKELHSHRLAWLISGDLQELICPLDEALE